MYYFFQFLPITLPDLISNLASRFTKYSWAKTPPKLFVYSLAPWCIKAMIESIQ